MGAGQHRMRIGELAHRVGINPKTIRYYEEAGLLPPPARTQSGYRIYSEEDAARLRFIKASKEFGFTLGEIKELLDVRDRGEAPCPYVLETARSKLEDLQDRIRRLERLSAELEGLLRDVENLPPEMLARKGEYCHIIESRRLRGRMALDR